MAASVLTESHVEDAALAWLGELGYTVLHGPDIAPGEPLAERDNYGQVVLAARLRRKLAELNPHIPADALDEAMRRLTRPASHSLVNNNRLFHRMVVDGVEVETGARTTRSRATARASSISTSRTTTTGSPSTSSP